MTARERRSIRTAIMSASQHDRERTIILACELADRRAEQRKARQAARTMARLRDKRVITMAQFLDAARPKGF